LNGQWHKDLWRDKLLSNNRPEFLWTNRLSDGWVPIKDASRSSPRGGRIAIGYWSLAVGGAPKALLGLFSLSLRTGARR
jgi:hypothetical protein